MGKFIGIGAGAVVEKDGQVEGLGGLVKVEEKEEEMLFIGIQMEDQV